MTYLACWACMALGYAFNAALTRDVYLNLQAVVATGCALALHYFFWAPSP